MVRYNFSHLKGQPVSIYFFFIIFFKISSCLGYFPVCPVLSHYGGCDNQLKKEFCIKLSSAQAQKNI